MQRLNETDRLVPEAQKGNKAALESLILHIQDSLFGLAVKMLYNPADAEDAVQDILIKVVKNLKSFRGESSFTTWVYRIAVNHILSVRKNSAEKTAVDFERYREELELEHAGKLDCVGRKSSAATVCGGNPGKLPAGASALP